MFSAGEILREQIRVADGDPEALLQEDHQLQKAQRIEDAALHQCMFPVSEAAEPGP